MARHTVRQFIAIVGVSCVLACSCLAAERQSADGMPFPPIGVADAPFKATLPFVHDKLGVAPEDLGSRLYSTTKSKELLARHADPKLLSSDWFGWGFGGSDAFGVDLDGGRIVRITLLYRAENPGRVGQVQTAMSRLGKADGEKYAVKNVASGEAFPVFAHADAKSATFAVDRVEWYLLTQKVEPEIAAGMRTKNPVKGMTVEAAIATFGDPESKIAGDNAVTCEWNFRVHKEPKAGGGVTMVDGGGFAAYKQTLESINEAQRRKQEFRIARTVRATFVDGKLSIFSDDHFNPKDE